MDPGVWKEILAVLREEFLPVDCWQMDHCRHLAGHGITAESCSPHLGVKRDYDMRTLPVLRKCSVQIVSRSLAVPFS